MPVSPVPLFDTHAHFFTDDVARYPVDFAGTAEGRDALMQRILRAPATPERVLAQWDALGIRGGVAVQYNTVYKRDNRYCLAVADRNPERVSAVVMLSAAQPETPALLGRLAGSHDIRGLRLHGTLDANGEYPWLDSRSALKTWDAASDLGLHIVAMDGSGRPDTGLLGQIARLARRYPDTAICLDHFGWTHDRAAPDEAIGPEHRALVDVPNIVFKFTHINLMRFGPAGTDPAGFLRHAIDLFGPHRIMWGSDHGNASRHPGIDYRAMVEGALAATALLEPDERMAVLHDNGRRLFGTRSSGELAGNS